MFCVNRHLQNLAAVVHGGLPYAELGRLKIDPQSIIDFSVSTNPSGPPAGIRRAISRAILEKYPDSSSTLLKTRLAQSRNSRMENIIVGSGSTELIRLAAAAYLEAGKKALILQPTYGEYALAVQLTGAQVVNLSLTEESNFQLDPAALKAAVEKYHPDVVFLCSPNNPTGEYLPRALMLDLLNSLPDTLLVLDEAYINFCQDCWRSDDLITYPNLLIIRSMTKDYSIAGLRLGYALANAEIIKALDKIKPPWNVSSYAQAAGIFVLEKPELLANLALKAFRAAKYLKDNLEKLGMRPLPSSANFFLVEVGDSTKLRQELLQRGIIVRDCTSFGLPQYWRIGVRSPAENRKLVQALRQILEKQK
jgi:histidinol-phosphate aminotransferase